MRKIIKNHLKNERGLTLVELLAVIVILAIVGAIAFVMIGNIIDNSRKDAHVANAMQLIDAAKLYEANGNEIGNGVSAKKLQDEGLLGEFIDPWKKNEYESLANSTEQAGNGTVKKEDNHYIVHLKADNDECDIGVATHGVKESDLIKDGRKACEKDYTPTS